MRAFNVYWERERRLRGGQCAVSGDGGDMGEDSRCMGLGGQHERGACAPQLSLRSRKPSRVV